MAIKFNFEAAPISQFARRSPEGEANAALNIGNTLTGIAKDIKDLYDESEMRKAIERASIERSVNEEVYGSRFYYSGEELDSTDYPDQKYEKNAQGETVPKEIASWKAEPYIRKRDNLKSLNNTAAGISDYFIRQRYIAQGKKAIESEFQRDVAASAQIGRQQVRFEIANQIDELVRTGQHDAALDLIDMTQVFTDSEKAEKRKMISVESEFYDVQGMIIKPTWNEFDFDQANKQIDYLANEEYKGALTREERIQLIDALRNKMKSEKTRGSFEEDAALVMQLKERISNKDPSVNAALLLRYWKEGRFKSGRAVSLWGEVLDWMEEERDYIKDQRDLVNRVGEGLGVDPNKKNREIVNNFFKDRAAAIKLEKESAGEEYTRRDRGKAATATAQQMGVIPDDILSDLRAYDRGTPEAVLEGARLYNELLHFAPQSADDLARQNLDTLANVQANLRLGLSEAEAVQSAIAIRDADALEEDVFNTVWKALTKTPAQGLSPLGGELRELISKDKNFKTWFWDSKVPTKPSVGLPLSADGLPLEMETDFNQLVKGLLRATGGNPRVAMARAYEIIQGRWMLTDINNPVDEIDYEFLDLKDFSKESGKFVMAYPPNKGPAMDPTKSGAMIRNDIGEKFRPLLRPGEYINITSDMRTIQEGKDRGLTNGIVTYPIYAIDTEGEPRLIGRWYYDVDDVYFNWREKVSAQRENDLEQTILKKLEEQAKQKALEDETVIWGP